MTDEPTPIKPTAAPQWRPPGPRDGPTPLAEVSAVSLERLLEAMCLISTINRESAATCAVLFRICAASAPHGPHGVMVTRLLSQMGQRLEQHMAGAGKPGAPPPSVA